MYCTSAVLFRIFWNYFDSSHLKDFEQGCTQFFLYTVQALYAFLKMIRYKIISLYKDIIFYTGNMFTLKGLQGIQEYKCISSVFSYLSLRIILPFFQCLSLSTLLKHALQGGWWLTYHSYSINTVEAPYSTHSLQISGKIIIVGERNVVSTIFLLNPPLLFHTQALILPRWFSLLKPAVFLISSAVYSLKTFIIFIMNNH